MLVGRERERRALDVALDRARLGESATLALVGEAGIGKTALLRHAAEHATGMQQLSARGVESEAQIPFASLLELIRPALALLEAIPKPQATALESALALRPSVAQERFAVGAATLSLLAAYAERAPVALLVDDAHWLDPSSAQALLFAVRRLVAEPIAVVLAVRDGEPSLLDGANLPTLRIGGLDRKEAETLLDGIEPETAGRLHEATAGNPLALLELASEDSDLALTPQGAPLLVPEKISSTFLRRVATLDEQIRSALVLAATSDSGDMATLARAAAGLQIDLSVLSVAERAGLIVLQPGSIEFRHPLVRSAVYAGASPDERRAAHRALANALPDRDVDRRAWHLSAAAVGVDETASGALEQAGYRARDRSGYATAAAAFERAGRLASTADRRGRLLHAAAEAAWQDGRAERAVTLLAEARASTDDAGTLLDVDELAGHIATRCGPVMQGHAILTAAAGKAEPERAVAMLAEAASACLYAGHPAEMLLAAERAASEVPDNPAIRTRFLAATALGMARVVGGDAAAGALAIHEAIALAEHSSELFGEIQLLPWLAMAPIFLRESETGRALLDQTLESARARAAFGALPFVLNMIARDQATTDRLGVAEATYREAIALAQESDQRTALAFGLSGLAWLMARRGEARECRSCATEALRLSSELGTRLGQVWATAAQGELELGLGEAAHAIEHYEEQARLLSELGFTDVDLSPLPELIEAYIRTGRGKEAASLAGAFSTAATAKGQPWSLARACRSRGLVAADGDFALHFDEALRHHADTPDAFELARTQLAYGERLRRARRRVLAREQLRAAAAIFDRLGARPWTDRARAELQATGVTLRRHDPATIDDLTPQELQIALQLAAGRTTRDTAATLFLSPKTVEYHLRHVYQKLGIHSRDELRRALAPDDAASASGARVRTPLPT